jgi:hypothetical protein
LQTKNHFNDGNITDVHSAFSEILIYMYEFSLQTSKLKGLTDGLEEKEQQLVNDCVQQLGMF